MSGIRKVITKKEAVTEAFHISSVLAEKPTHPAWSVTKHAWCEIEWSGKWKVTDYLIEELDFEISAGRWKHLDGRIRDARSEAMNTLGFAAFCVEHFPNREMSKVWCERLANEKLVQATLERPLRKWFAMPSSLNARQISEAIREASILAKVSA